MPRRVVELRPPPRGAVAEEVLGFLSMEQAGELLSLSRREVYRLVHSGEVRSGKIGRKTVIDRGSVLAFMRRVLNDGRPDVESIAAKGRAALRSRRATASDAANAAETTNPPREAGLTRRAEDEA